MLEAEPARLAYEAAQIESVPIEQQADTDNVLLFLVNKESGPLYPDLLVQLNTSELLHDTMFDSIVKESDSRSRAVKENVGTADLLESIVSNIDSSFNIIQQPVEQPQFAMDAAPEQPAAYEIVEPTAVEPAAQVEAPASPVEPSESFELIGPTENVNPIEQQAPWNVGVFDNLTGLDGLQDIFEELKENTGSLQPMKDFETHYSLGLAYKDMDLLDDAIGEFQRAFRMAGVEDLKGDYIQCCNMLGVCFKRKQMPKVAVMWFERGLKIPNRPEDEYQALRYEIALCHEELGELDKALDTFMEVYGIDVNYREVARKIKQLQSAKDA